MIKHFLTLAILIFFSSEVMSQRFSMEEWHKGEVTLSGGEKIEGLIKYNFENNSVQVQGAGSNEVYAISAQKIVSFNFIDKRSEVFRQFYSLPYSIMNNNYKAPTLFEVVVQGPLTFLTREKIETRTRSFNGYRSYSRPELVYTFYFLNDKDEIIEYAGRKKDIDPLLHPYQNEVQKYMKQERLKTDRRTDLAKITIYYNKLHDNRQ